ncbi:enoyl-CoA hydratase/isomerase family protein [Blastococcus sp. MG754426]|uniref:enoyl-CoA hydratase/isomerase family protein n=1 Tax=unclassified Blastococcus TaxID=2619396 RepID=UPI001EF0ABC9|nr:MULTISPECIES: enoyl-CoA hydratase/isomerase family protein [unclassified Blastococcus]MCF6508696.1 enoyl-CoA hydratase/isomerase family protein [Blastococcus sp. MG754426]MCF6513275.1 enoyl-CoA hydratase/isomerase family protein [Blastococcus sp. MG754427]
MTEHLRVTRDGPVAVLIIDRPEKRNAMTVGMWAALPAVLAPLADDPGVRALLVTGAGPSFCAGADISDLLGGPDPVDPMAEVRRHNLAAQAALRSFPKPTLAVVRGHCIGGGVELATCCDLRFADPTAVFGVTPAKVGIVYTPASTRALVDLVGPATTKYLLYSGELVDAGTALRTGLVDRLVDADDLDAEAHRFAAVLASRSGLTQRSTKEVVAALADGGDGEALAAARYRETIAAGELAEGVAAFTERRAPRFPWSG